MTTSYAIDSQGSVYRTDISRHQLAPSKQVAVRFMKSAARKHYDNPGKAADNGYVRAFKGTIQEFCNFAINTLNIRNTEIYFQDQFLNDESVVSMEEVDQSYSADEFQADLEEGYCYQVFEDHVILFCNKCLDVWPFEQADCYDGSRLL